MTIQLEIDIAAWLCDNAVQLQDIITKAHIPCQHLFPSDIYQDAYAEGALVILKTELLKSFNLNPEELTSIVTPNFVTTILGKQFLLPKEGTYANSI